VKFVNDRGSLTGFAILLAFATGLLMLYVSVEWLNNMVLRNLFFTVWLTLVAGAGWGAQGNTLGLRAFGSSTWRTAKKTYESVSKDSGNTVNSEVIR
jgi:hypothetical protein